MTISTSSSARTRGLAILAAFALTAGCGQPGDAAKAPDRPPATAAAAGPKAPPTIASERATSPAAVYSADLARAIAGEKKVAFPATEAFGGMTCTPGTIAGGDAATRRLTLTLPEDRAHVLAVVTPERGLLEVYSPYDAGTEAGDLIVPSSTMSWAKARDQRTFATSTDALDGLRPGSDTPEALFIEPGRYRFVLANGIDAALLKADGKTPVATAGCTFDWTP